MATCSKKILVLGWAPPDKEDVDEQDVVDGDLLQEDLSTWLGTTCSAPPPHNPFCTLSRATAPCSYSALEFIKYPGVDGVLLMATCSKKILVLGWAPPGWSAVSSQSVLHTHSRHRSLFIFSSWVHQISRCGWCFVDADPLVYLVRHGVKVEITNAFIEMHFATRYILETYIKCRYNGDSSISFAHRSIVCLIILTRSYSKFLILSDWYILSPCLTPCLSSKFLLDSFCPMTLCHGHLVTRDSPDKDHHSLNIVQTEMLCTATPEHICRRRMMVTIIARLPVLQLNCSIVLSIEHAVYFRAVYPSKDQWSL